MFLRLPDRKLLGPNGANISTSKTKISKMWKVSQIWTEFVFGIIHPHQTFTECVSNQYTHLSLSIC